MELARNPANLAEIFIVMPGSLLNSEPDWTVGLTMTRTGVPYVAMVAAGVSVGALGYAVLWAYHEPEALPVTMSAPPVANIAPVNETQTPAPPVPVESVEPRAVAPAPERATSTPTPPVVAAAPQAPVSPPAAEHATPSSREAVAIPE